MKRYFATAAMAAALFGMLGVVSASAASNTMIADTTAPNVTVPAIGVIDIHNQPFDVVTPTHETAKDMFLVQALNAGLVTGDGVVTMTPAKPIGPNNKVFCLDTGMEMKAGRSYFSPPFVPEGGSFENCVRPFSVSTH